MYPLGCCTSTAVAGTAASDISGVAATTATGTVPDASACGTSTARAGTAFEDRSSVAVSTARAGAAVATATGADTEAPCGAAFAAGTEAKAARTKAPVSSTPLSAFSSLVSNLERGAEEEDEDDTAKTAATRVQAARAAMKRRLLSLNTIAAPDYLPIIPTAGLPLRLPRYRGKKGSSRGGSDWDGGL